MDAATIERAIELREEHCGDKATLTDEEKAQLAGIVWDDRPLFHLAAANLTKGQQAAPRLETILGLKQKKSPLTKAAKAIGIAQDAFEDIAVTTKRTLFNNNGWTEMTPATFESALCTLALLQVAEEGCPDPFVSDGPEPSKFELALADSRRLLAANAPQSSELPPAPDDFIRDFHQSGVQNAIKVARAYYYGPEESAPSTRETANMERMELAALVLDLDEQDVHTAHDAIEAMVMRRHPQPLQSPESPWRKIRPHVLPTEYIRTGRANWPDMGTSLAKVYEAARTFQETPYPGHRTELVAFMGQELQEAYAAMEPPHFPEEHSLWPLVARLEDEPEL